MTIFLGFLGTQMGLSARDMIVGVKDHVVANRAEMCAVLTEFSCQEYKVRCDLQMNALLQHHQAIEANYLDCCRQGARANNVVEDVHRREEALQDALPNLKVDFLWYSAAT